MAKNDKTPAPETANASAPSGGTQILKKISNDLFKAVEIGVRFTVAGIVRGLETKTSDKGEYTKFTGDFAVKIGDEITKANILYVPQVAEGLLKDGYFKALEAGGAEAKAVSCEFSFNLFKVKSEKSKTGYVWGMETRKAITPETDRTLALLN